MPQLVYGNRKWAISSDDLSFLLALPFLLRIVSIFSCIFLMALSTFADVRKSDQDYSFPIVYLYLSISLHFIIVINDYFLIQHSLVGTMADNLQRSRKVSSFLSFRAVLGSLQAIMILVAMSSVVYIYEIRQSNLLLCGLTFFQLFYHFIDVVGIFFFYSCSSGAYGGCRQPLAEDHHDGYSEYHYEKDISHQEIGAWKSRCARACKFLQHCTCNLFGGAQIAEDLESVARIITEVFHHEGLLDVVLSDIIAGIVLVSTQQSDLIFDESTNLESGNSLKTIISYNNDWERSQYLESLYRYSVYAASIYTCVLRVYTEPCSSCWKFCTQGCNHPCRCCDGKQKYKQEDGQYLESIDRKLVQSDGKIGNESYDTVPNELIVEGSDCCGSHLFALKDWTKDLSCKIIYANLTNDTTMKPFAVFFDSSRNELIISIRGTLSLEDCITDAMAEPAEMTEAGEQWGFHGQNRWAHEGMLRSALHIRQDLDEKKIFTLVKMLIKPSPEDKGITSDLALGCQIIVCGHSLGAGVAALLALLLRRDFPTVKCFAFGVPGCVVDQQTSLDMKDYVTSVILGCDMIPRSSFRSVLSLKTTILDCISRAKANKFSIFESAIRSAEIDSLLFPPNQAPDCDFTRKLMKFKELQQERLRNSSRRRYMCIPGQIFYLQLLNSNGASRSYSSPLGSTPGSCSRLKSALCCQRSRRYRVNPSVSVDDFQEIIVDPSMVWDHLPDRYMYELQSLYQQDLQSGMMI